MTFTSYKELTFEREEPIDNLFPSGELRPYKARKPVIFVSARVHPGEVPGSHIMNGFLDFLAPQNEYSELSLDHRASTLLNYFVIKIVPMLNPDGVARGHYRFD